MKILMAMSMLLAGCYSSISGTLVGSEWKLEGDGQTFVRFEANGKVVGNGGCNGFFGTFTLQGHALRFGPLASTRKLCAPKIMEVENVLLSGLRVTMGFKRAQTRLTLFDAQGKTALILRQTDWD